MNLDQNHLRALAGLILLVLALVFLILQSENGTIEYILIALAAFVVGAELFGRNDDGNNK